jgi:hypothetical protein
MGYWKTPTDSKTVKTPTIWGDAPADMLDMALTKVIEVFTEAVGRRPTKLEIRQGLEFSLGGFDDLKDE